MADLALSVAISNAPKEYAIKKPAQPQKPQEEAIAVSQGLRESGIEWLKEASDLKLSNRISEQEYLLSTSTTDTSVKFVRSGSFSQEMLQELKSKFKKMFVAAYSNVFSHNRLLAKVSEWMVGNVMERLALMGISQEELDEVRGQVRGELISQNKVALEQIVYDETMLEIV